MQQPKKQTLIRITSAFVAATALLLSGCGGGGGGSGSAASANSNDQSNVQGIATPGNVAVVTAQNADAGG